MSDNEWYTPQQYVNAAREVMGTIDLDPASCELANKTVQASFYYTKEDNGLTLPWSGRIWLNPPYGVTNGVNNQKAFTEKLLSEYHANRIEQAIILTLGVTNNAWFQPLLHSFPICFHSKNIRFNRKDGSTGTFGFPLAFTYLGKHETRFKDIFSQFGPIVKKI